MRFVIYVIDVQANPATGNEMEAIDAFNDKLEADGNWIMAAGIAAPPRATLIDNRNDANIVTEGSLFNTDNFYSGFWIIKTETAEEALELAKAGSKACNRRVELRPFLGQ